MIVVVLWLMLRFSLFIVDLFLCILFLEVEDIIDILNLYLVLIIFVPSTIDLQMLVLIQILSIFLLFLLFLNAIIHLFKHLIRRYLFRP